MRALKVILTAALATATLNTSALAGGVHIGTGGGLSESNVTFAYLSIDSFLDQCLETFNPCWFTDNERGIATTMRAQISRERSTADQINFLAEADANGIFNRDGQTVLAVTGPAVGDKIFFNLDLSYPVENGFKVALTVRQATETLVAQLGAHVDGASTIDVKGVATKVAEMTAGSVETLTFGNRGIDWMEPSIRPTVTNIAGGNDTASRIMISDSQDAFEITDIIAAALPCAEPSSFSASNLYWETYTRDWHRHGMWVLTMRIAARTDCIKTDGTRFAGTYNASVHLEIDNQTFVPAATIAR